MKYVKGKISITVIVMLGLIISSVNVLADPVVDEITTDPTSPTHQSTITITATITGDDITSVNITVLECKVGLCFTYSTYIMSQNGEGNWVAEATLQDDSGRSTYIKYVFNIVDSGVEYQDITSDNWKVDLSIDDVNGGNGIPGFETITLLAAIIIGIILLRRMRF